MDKGLLFYDASVGHGELYTITSGRIARTRLHTGWRSTWTQIVPGNFGGGSRSDLLFYAPSSFTGEFYTTDDDGRIALLQRHTLWRSTWTQIVPGQFGGDGFTDLLFYDPTTNTGEFYATDGLGNIRLLRRHSDWRPTWTRIIPGNFGGDGFTDLLFYDAANGVASSTRPMARAISACSGRTPTFAGRGRRSSPATLGTLAARTSPTCCSTTLLRRRASSMRRTAKAG